MSTGTVMTVNRLGFAESEMLDFSYARTLAYAGYGLPRSQVSCTWPAQSPTMVAIATPT